MKRFISLLLALFVAVSLFTFPSFADKDSDVKYGLTVSENGRLMLNDKEFYGLGECVFGSFVNFLENPIEQVFVEDFKILKQYNIPFARIPFSGYAANYYDTFDTDPDMVLTFLDMVVKEAEKQNIGIIASLMWWDPALSAHVGEQRSAMGDVNSKTTAYAKEYVATIVQRYKDSPAIWGWEIGNEYNLTADLCDKNFENYLWPNGIPSMPIKGDGYDYYTSAELRVFYEEIAKEIRKYDDYRIISNGNGEMRGAAKAMHEASEAMDTDTHTWTIRWTEQTREEFYEMNEYYAPDPIDAMCFHFQHGTNGGDPEAYLLEHKVFREGTISLTDYLKAYVEAARLQNKVAYFGEFGDFIDMEDAPDCAEKFQYVVDCIAEADIQLASAWHFQQATDKGIHGEKLKIMSASNLKFQEKGLQDISAYWSSVKAEPTPTKAPSLTDESYAFADTIEVNKTAKTIKIDPMTVQELFDSLTLADGFTASISDRSGADVSGEKALESGFYITITAPEGTVYSSFRFIVNEPTPTPLPENTLNLSDEVRIAIFIIAVVGVSIGVIITSIMLNKRSRERRDGLR